MINTSHIGRPHGFESTLPTQPSRRAESTTDTSEFGRFLADLVDKIDTASAETGDHVSTGPAPRAEEPAKK